MHKKCYDDSYKSGVPTSMQNMGHDRKVAIKTLQFSAAKIFFRHFGWGFEPVNPPPLKYGPDLNYKANPDRNRLLVHTAVVRRGADITSSL